MYDERHRDTLLDYLRKRRHADGPDFRVYRPDIERVGANMGLTPGQSTALFEDLEGVYWWGTFHTVEELSGWALAVVERVA
jgi:hypothetical protein